MRLERLLLAGVSLLLVGGFGLLGVGLGGGRPDLLPAGRLMVGAAVALACLPLVALGITVGVERLRGRAGGGGR
ncbi:MAG: hypothetical protein JNM72_01655 [Deltaproteobacteria bacterium]|nr:hypothetical protein [Deltaproteobacteria bacterium]